VGGMELIFDILALALALASQHVIALEMRSIGTS